MVFVSIYAYWHCIVAGFLSPNQRMILDCYMMSHPMIPYGVVLCPPVVLTSHLTLVRELGRGCGCRLFALDSFGDHVSTCE